MSIAEKSVRQSVTLPARVARRVKSLAKTSSTSANRIIVELIESGIEARQQERKRFIELADRLARSRDVEEQTRLKEELAVMTFGAHSGHRDRWPADPPCSCAGFLP
jgi:predicted DNA-binding protein